MVHKIEYGDRGDTVSCYLPEGSVPDKSAVEELHRMTGLEETLEKFGEYPGFFQGDNNRIEKIILDQNRSHASCAAPFSGMG